MNRIGLPFRGLALILPMVFLTACADLPASPGPNAPAATLASQNSFVSKRTRNIANQPPRSKPIRIAVYDIPDKTGANKSNSDFAEISRALTQGANALVIDALSRTGGGTWFSVTERANHQSLLNERSLSSQQIIEARQRVHVRAERQRVKRATDRLESEIGQLRQQVAAEFATAQKNGRLPAGTPSYEQTLANIDALYNRRRNSIEGEKPFSAFEGPVPVQPLTTADYILTGSIVAYDSDVQTSGSGLRVMNVGGKKEVRRDIITVNLRVVNVRSGSVLSNKTITQMVASERSGGSILNYITINTVLEFEAGYATNEPKTFALDAAFQKALLENIAEMQARGYW
jgi:curli biogenesis system outer membrane secretion channel CsgG